VRPARLLAVAALLALVAAVPAAAQPPLPIVPPGTYHSEVRPGLSTEGA
jgi:hypothetical protein